MKIMSNILPNANTKTFQDAFDHCAGTVMRLDMTRKGIGNVSSYRSPITRIAFDASFSIVSRLHNNQLDAIALAIPEVPKLKPLVWTATPIASDTPDHEHIIAPSALGEFRIDWKNSNETPSFDVYVNGEPVTKAFDLQSAKAKASLYLVQIFIKMLVPDLLETQVLLGIPA